MRYTIERLRIYSNSPTIHLDREVCLLTSDVMEFAQLLRHSQPILITELQIILSHYPGVQQVPGFEIEDSRRTFQNMLESLSPTLKILKLCVISIEAFRLPTLEVLESLKIDFGRGVFPGPPITPFTSELFNNLTSLTLYSYQQHWQLLGTQPFLRLTKLKLVNFEGTDENYPWNELFPSLDTLELIDSGADALRIFMERFSFIRHLKLKFVRGVPPRNYEEDRERMICNILAAPISTPLAAKSISLADFQSKEICRNC